MKKIFSILTVALITAIIFSFNKPSTNSQSVNSIIGDVSFIKKFGVMPGNNTDEDLRLRTHLEYVEAVLRKKDVSNLPKHLKEKRKQLLDHLHAYWTAGIFPRNYDYKDDRKPCFIDKNNRICAVGYLIEKTAGRKAAEKINATYKYDKILAMNDTGVDNWIDNSGLTKLECAMIQPNYGPSPDEDYIPKSYGIASSFIGGINFSANTINTIQLIKGSNSKTVPIIGLVTGAGQVILGATNFPQNTSGPWGYSSNESKKRLSMLNIGMGTTTMLLSAWNLINNNPKKIKERSTSWNIYTIPAERSRMNMGVSLTRKL